mmetsp:Transcript_7771/g.10610  ORF Transcript_7771/g.10610 Transcript_7771/m.10610 type:complete len:198 (+) Transcript_7771:176-769(+)
MVLCPRGVFLLRGAGRRRRAVHEVEDVLVRVAAVRRGDGAGCGPVELEPGAHLAGVLHHGEGFLARLCAGLGLRARHRANHAFADAGGAAHFRGRVPDGAGRSQVRRAGLRSLPHRQFPQRDALDRRAVEAPHAQPAAQIHGGHHAPACAQHVLLHARAGSPYRAPLVGAAEQALLRQPRHCAGDGIAGLGRGGPGH